MAVNLPKMIMRMDESRVLTKFIKVRFLLCHTGVLELGFNAPKDTNFSHFQCRLWIASETVHQIRAL